MSHALCQSDKRKTGMVSEFSYAPCDGRYLQPNLIQCKLEASLLVGSEGCRLAVHNLAFYSLIEPLARLAEIATGYICQIYSF